MRWYEFLMVLTLGTVFGILGFASAGGRRPDTALNGDAAAITQNVTDGQLALIGGTFVLALAAYRIVIRSAKIARLNAAAAAAIIAYGLGQGAQFWVDLRLGTLGQTREFIDLTDPDHAWLNTAIIASGSLVAVAVAASALCFAIACLFIFHRPRPPAS